MEKLMTLTAAELSGHVQARWGNAIYPFAIRHRRESGSTITLALKLADHGHPDALKLVNAVFPNLARHLNALH